MSGKVESLNTDQTATTAQSEPVKTSFRSILSPSVARELEENLDSRLRGRLNKFAGVVELHPSWIQPFTGFNDRTLDPSELARMDFQQVADITLVFMDDTQKLWDLFRRTQHRYYKHRNRNIEEAS